MPITAGAFLGRYRLLEKAGAGGMSEVWKADDTTLHRTVAVKVILAPIAEDPTYQERFLREARLVAGLDHPNVLPVYDFGTASVDGSEVSYLVMPLVPGGSLKSHITGPMPFGIAVAWLAAVGSALDHAHARGILHRDVKPANVLVDSQGRPLLADFGLARSSETVSGLTQTGTVLGTPLYMAPEQAQGVSLDARADQYALGVIAFEVLTGVVPFRADSPLAVLHQHVVQPPPPASTLVSGFPPGADAVLAKALAKKPDDRYPDCGSFIAALASALGVPLVARTGSATAVPTGGAPAAGVPPSRAELSGAATVVSGPQADPKGRLAAPASVPPPPAAPVAAPGVPAAPTVPSAKRPSSGARLLLVAGIVLVALLLAALYVSRLRTQKSAEIASVPPVPTAPLPVPAPTGAPVAAPTSPSTAAEAPAPVPAEPATSAPPSPVRPGKAARVAEARPSARRDVPRSEPAPRLPRPAPLLGSASFSGDTRLEGAYHVLDNSQKNRLSREDFVDAMGTVRGVLATNPSREVKVLDTYTRAAVAFADGRNAEAWQLLNRAFDDAPALAEGRVLGFVDRQMRAIGPNPGPDGNWVLGLAFCDVRGDLAEELGKAVAKAPSSARVRYALALAAWQRGDGAEAAREARAACDAGLSDACNLLR
jgi:serine/threonine-protein kinase